MRQRWARGLTTVTLALVVALLLTTAPPLGQGTAAAPSGAWTEIAPEGVEVTALALDAANPNTVYAGVLPYNAGPTAPNLYRSADGGQTWTATGARVPAPDVDFNRLTKIISASGALYVIVNANKLYRSTDAGGSWTQINTGPITGGVSDIAADPSNASVLYVTHAGRVYKSVDGGATWNLSDTGLPLDASVNLVAVAPSAPNIVYAFNSMRVYRSADSGASWQIAAGTLGFNHSTGFAVDAAAPGTLYASASGGGVFRSPDGGDIWAPIHTGLGTQNVDRLGVDQSQTGVLYAATTETFLIPPIFTYTYPIFRLHRSTDGGTTWAPVLDSLTRAAAIVGRGGAAYVGSGHGVYRSSNGTSWALSNRGLPRLPLLSLLVGPTSGTLYAGVRGSGVWRSQDQGETWLPPNASLRAANPTALEYDPTNPNILYAATFDSRHRSGVSKSVDGGVTWTQTGLESLQGNPSGDSVPWYHDLAVQPANPSRIHAGGYFDREFSSGFGVIMPSPVLRVSTDGGATWSANLGPDLSTGPVTSFAVAPAPATTAYLGAKRASYDQGQPPTSGSVRKSPDGAAWPPTAALPQNAGVLALALDPSSPTTVYAGTDGARVVKTTDGGQSWAAAGAGLPDAAVTVLTLDQAAPQTLYAGTVDQGIYKTTNGGASWTPISASGAPTYLVALAVDPTAPSILYAIDGNRLLALNQAQIPATPTPTTVPAICAPRPQIRVQTAPSGSGGSGGLAATVTLTTNAGTPTNAFQKIAFTGGQNVMIETPGSPPRAPGFEYTPGSGSTTTFVVRRVNPGPYTAQLTVTDACGPWQTFVGGGANAP